MRPRTTEVKQIVSLLDREHADVEDMAKELLQLAWELFDKRERYCLVFDQPDVGVTVHGPFSSIAEIKKAIGKSIVAAGPGKPKAGIFQLILHADMTEGMFDV